MSTSKELVSTIIEGIQAKKGHDIITVDLKGIITAPCEYFVICNGNSPLQVKAICDSVEEFARTKANEKPSKIAGLTNSLWVAMDYGTVMVHIFVPDAREHYDLEHLWADGEPVDISEYLTPDSTIE